MYDFFLWATTAYRVPVEEVDAVITIRILHFRLFLPGKPCTGGNPNSQKGICGGDVGGGRGPSAGVGGRSPVGGCHSSCHILHYPLLQS
jgi:hypothetical protein